VERHKRRFRRWLDGTAVAGKLALLLGLGSRSRWRRIDDRWRGLGRSGTRRASVMNEMAPSMTAAAIAMAMMTGAFMSFLL
jgi:hypothetical protein